MGLLGPNADGELPLPGRVPDCYLGLRLDPDDRDDQAAGVLVVAPAALLHPLVPQPDGTVLYELVTGHPDRTPQELPSGQQIARAMRVNVLSNPTLGLSNDPGWGGEAPLWFYILKEAELPPYKGERLGPVGGRIMAETLVGLLQRDPNSYLYLNAAWKPAPPIAPTTGQFSFVDLLKYAGAA